MLRWTDPHKYKSVKKKMYTYLKLDEVALLITDPPPTSSNTLQATNDMWHVSNDMWHVPSDTHEHCLKTSSQGNPRCHLSPTQTDTTARQHDVQLPQTIVQLWSNLPAPEELRPAEIKLFSRRRNVSLINTLKYNKSIQKISNNDSKLSNNH